MRTSPLSLDGRRSHLAIATAVFLSGASALIFETLWFRLAGLMLGNSVWASSLVLGAFMAGLATGSVASGRIAPRLRMPLAGYAVLEVTIGLLGTGLVLLLPMLTPILAPWLRPFLAQPLTLNAMRLTVAFALLALPASAMGATLPTLVRALNASSRDYGNLLGRLYGWNTLGAVTGALAGEGWLIGQLGLRGTAAAACALNGGAALIAWRMARTASPRRADVPDAPLSPSVPAPSLDAVTTIRLLLTAAACGGALLGLEVVWLRFLALRIATTSLAFAVMLSVVLLGIGAGGLIGARWTARRADTAFFVPPLALTAGAVTILCYRQFEPHASWYSTDLTLTWWLAVQLMAPVCLVSGILFVLVGSALEQVMGDRTLATAWLTAANTIGAVTGSLCAGLVLLPRLGIGGALLALAGVYSVTLVSASLRAPRGARVAVVVAGAALVLATATFPHGLARRTMLAQLPPQAARESSVLAMREGVVDTLVYMRRSLWDRPYVDWMVTNGFSMTNTRVSSRRYMNAFVYWPVAVRPDVRSALLVCYGVGNTARALTATPQLTSIDIVDISPDVLKLAALVMPRWPQPLADPRVRTHVEDGRFFLLTTDRRFDLITAEPPPPKLAGVGNLYSREYFRLVRDHLAPRGIATHWLPVHMLDLDDTRAIVAGFCSVFADCSLWNGVDQDWMLVGTNGLTLAPTEEEFGRQWSAPGSAHQIRVVGFETPEMLGATFLADAGQLRALAAGHAPLEDDHPLRMTSRVPTSRDPFYARVTDAGGARARFEGSDLVRRLWPPALRQRSLAWFDVQEILDRVWRGRSQGLERMEDLRRVLADTRLRSLALLLMETDEDEVALAADAAGRGVKDPSIAYVQGLDALADRDYPRARAALDEAARGNAPVANLTQARALTAALAGSRGEARAIAAAGAPLEFQRWIETAFP